MQLDELLVARGLLQPADIEQAVARRRERGGRLLDNLLALRLISLQQLDVVLKMTPPHAPNSIEDTGIGERSLLRLLIAAMYVAGENTAPKLTEALKLPSGVVVKLLQIAMDRKLAEIVGTEAGSTIRVVIYALTDLGRGWAIESQEQTKYVGPAPVPLDAYCDQIKRQRIGGDRVDREQIRRAFSDLIVTEPFITRLGPAINSGRSILLYGPPGNGKSSVAEKIGGIFSDIIYIPHCIDADGQIIRIFDPSIHERVTSPSGPQDVGIRREDFDERWVACHRPIVITGGELSLEMLDLRFSQLSGFYEAPLHIKALGGTFVVDDFGRQLIRPQELLNRWAIPLEDGVDYFKLHTGKTFSLPFDELVIFSTNLVPDDLMDPAFLRRIPYKIEIGAPSIEEYRQIFETAAESYGLKLQDSFVPRVVELLRTKGGIPLASYQPRFILDQIVSACRFDGVEPYIGEEFLANALENLHARPAQGRLLADQPLDAAAMTIKPTALSRVHS
jgi:hypothetical protein